MSNPNTVTVYSPENEPFEMSRVNARDLLAHAAGWTDYDKETRSAPVAKPAAPEPEEAPDATVEGSSEDAPAEPEATETGEAEESAPAEETPQEEVASVEAATVRTTEADFDDLPSREDVVKYLAEAFPDYRPHHLTKRAGLVAKAIELAAE